MSKLPVSRLLPGPILPLVAFGTLFCAADLRAVEYEVAVQTKDKSKAVTGQARLGSFGAPSINDLGAIAYSCVMSGKGVGGVTSYGIAFQNRAKAAPKVVLQGGVESRLYMQGRCLNNDFARDPRPSNIYPIDGSNYIFRISKSVALNNKKKIAFAGESVWVNETDNYDDNGNVTNSTTAVVKTAVYGTINASSGTYQNYSWGNYGNNGGQPPYRFLSKVKNSLLTSYESYFAEILTRDVSINNQGCTAYNATFNLTPDEAFPGFAWVSPSQGLIVATTASNAIGLPFFTTFQSFTQAVITDQNRCFVVADLSDAGDEFDGIWQGNNSNLQPVTVKGRVAPGGGKFESFDGTVGPSRKGKSVAFVANVSGGPNTRGVFRTNLAGEAGVLVAATGDKAPGAGVNFQDFGLAAVSDRGHVAFTGIVAPSGTSTRNREGLWLSDVGGENLQLIALEGQTLLVDKTEKTITRIAFNPISGLNKKGQVAFTASFSDRTSAVIVAKR